MNTAIKEYETNNALVQQSVTLSHTWPNVFMTVVSSCSKPMTMRRRQKPRNPVRGEQNSCACT